MAGYMDEEAVRKLLYDHEKCSVEGFWEEFEASNDVESLAMLVERLDFFSNPHVGAKIAELLRAPHKNKPRKKGRLYEIDKNHIRKNHDMLVAEYPDKAKKWRLSVLHEWFPKYTVKAIEQIID